jgi:hypothetical protein
MLESNEAPDLTVPVDEFPGMVSNDGKKAAAVKAFEALRAHGKAGIERNLDAAASIAALKMSLPHGEFGRFCKGELQISTSYGARLLKLDKLRDHVSDALAWAGTRKHRLAECQSARNLVELVGDWLKRDEPLKPKTASRTRDAQSGKDSTSVTESTIQEDAGLVAELEKTLSELKSELANKNDTLTDLRRSLTECDRDFVSLRDQIPVEMLDKAFAALASSCEAEFATIAKRYHWRLSDLRRELQN